MISGQTGRDPYAARIEQIRQEEHVLARRSRRLTRCRGLTFLPAVALVVFGWISDTPGHGAYWTAAGLIAIFVILVGIHERLSEQLVTLEHRRMINEQQLQRRQRAWTGLPVPDVEVPEDAAALARDLDLFGSMSVFHWLCLAQTPLGVARLRDWLIRPADPTVTAERQEAVRWLAPQAHLREELQLRGRLVASSGKGPNSFLAWAESPGWLAPRPRLTWIVRILTLAMALLIAVALLTPYRLAAFAAVVSLVVVHLVINLRCVPEIHDLFEVVASRQNDVVQYRAALSLLRDLPSDGAKFIEIRRSLGGDADEPIRYLDDLSRRVRLAAARHSPLWGIPYLFLQWFVLWDFHVLGVIESWQRRHGHRARRWFEALAELEALASLSAVAHDNPSWAFANVNRQQTRFVASQLGHPLLRDEVRVANDVQIGPPGTFLLVSGSNMSGKSTLLRAVGINALLAQAGSPTCSVECQMPPLEVATSMRIGDSLADGVSFYMAELHRLKQIVDLATRRPEDHPKLLYLLDEILLGTNSTERHIAVMRVIRHLLDAGAMGAMSTHDLELARTPELADACQSVHFREQIIERDGKSVMTFDYRMRPGVATTTNALKLLELVGLG
jgi:hypothetical protein